MSVHGRMPVVATTESGREFTWRRHVRIAVQDMADLVWVFLMDAGQSEFCEALGGGRVEGWNSNTFRRQSKRRKQDQSGEENSHYSQRNRNYLKWRLKALGSARVSRVGFGVSPKQAFREARSSRAIIVIQEKVRNCE